MSKSFCDMSIEILQKTEDGEKLSPLDLKVVEMAVNGYLNEQGEIYFQDLYKRVSDGIYKKPWHLGVEFMTKDHEGYIYFKGKHVEHYSFRDIKEEKKALIELQKDMLYLESIGMEPCLSNFWELENNVLH